MQATNPGFSNECYTGKCIWTFYPKQLTIYYTFTHAHKHTHTRTHWWVCSYHERDWLTIVSNWSRAQHAAWRYTYRISLTNERREQTHISLPSNSWWAPGVPRGLGAESSPPLQLYSCTWFSCHYQACRRHNGGGPHQRQRWVSQQRGGIRTEVKRVASFKRISKDLSWTLDTSTLVKKAHQAHWRRSICVLRFQWNSLPTAHGTANSLSQTREQI